MELCYNFNTGPWGFPVMGATMASNTLNPPGPQVTSPQSSFDPPDDMGETYEALLQHCQQAFTPQFPKLSTTLPMILPVQSVVSFETSLKHRTIQQSRRLEIVDCLSLTDQSLFIEVKRSTRNNWRNVEMQPMEQQIEDQLQEDRILKQLQMKRQLKEESYLKQFLMKSQLEEDSYPKQLLMKSQLKEDRKLKQLLMKSQLKEDRYLKQLLLLMMVPACVQFLLVNKKTNKHCMWEQETSSEGRKQRRNPSTQKLTTESVQGFCRQPQVTWSYARSALVC